MRSPAGRPSTPASALALLLLPLAASFVSCRTGSAPRPAAAPAAEPAPGWLKTVAGGGPRTGDVFREVVVKAPNGKYAIVAGSKNTKPSDPKFKNLKFKTSPLDLTGVKKVEIRMEIWSGHPQTNLRQVSFNGNPYVDLADNALPTARAADPKGGLGDYMAFIYSTTEIPLSHLKDGENDFHFECEGGEWELFDWWAITFRLYHDPATPAPRGRIVAPAPGAAIGDDARFEVEASSPNGAIARVEIIGAYEDFNHAGDGENEGWQFRTYHGEYLDHVGTATAAPWAVTWDTRWVPDQRRPMKFLARVTDEKGFTTLTPVVDGVTLARRGRSVRLYRATEIPRDYTAFDTVPKENAVDPILEDLAKAKAARARIVTYNGAAADGIFLNGEKLVDRPTPDRFVYDASVIDVPVSTLRPQANRFRVQSVHNTTQHGVDVMYPGLELKVAYEGIEPAVATAR
jgi:hypothetical protein